MRPPGRADRLTILVQTFVYGARLGSAAQIEEIHAIEAALITAFGQLSAAVIMEADVARVAPVLAIIDDVNTFAVWRPARPAGCRTGCGASRLMVASHDDKT